MDAPDDDMLRDGTAPWLRLPLGADRNLEESFGDIGSGYLLTCPDPPDAFIFVVQSH